MAQHTATYHEAAIKYNEGLAEAAEAIAPTLGDPDITRWCISVGKQHRFHANRHKAGLEKVLRREAEASQTQDVVEVEQIPDGLDVPDVEETVTSESETAAILADPDTMAAIEEADAELAAPASQAEVIAHDPAEPAEGALAQPVERTAEEEMADPSVFSDGCVGHHRPVDPGCEFNPNKADL